MKVTIAALVATLSLASAGITPELSVSVNSKDANELTGRFDSSMKWTTEGSYAGTNYEGGVNMRAESFGGDAPFNIWGKLNRNLGGWDLRAKVDTTSDDIRRLDFDVEAEGGPTDIKLRAQGNMDTANQSGEIREVELSQSFDIPSGEVAISPRYNLNTGKADVTLAYENSDTDTTITIAANSDQQRVTVSQRIDENNEIAPTITSDGDIELRYKRIIGDGVMTANYKPNESTSIQWEDGPWTARADFPTENFYKLGGPQLSIKRSINVDAN